MRPTRLDSAVCKGGPLRFLNLGWTEHFFSNDYGGGEECWRSGCDAQWFIERAKQHVCGFTQSTDKGPGFACCLESRHRGPHEARAAWLDSYPVLATWRQAS